MLELVHTSRIGALMSTPDSRDPSTFAALNAVVDALQEAGDDDAMSDTLNLVVNLTAHLAGSPARLDAFRAGGESREREVRQALLEAYGGEIPDWLADLVAPFAPGVTPGDG